MIPARGNHIRARMDIISINKVMIFYNAKVVISNGSTKNSLLKIIKKISCRKVCQNARGMPTNALCPKSPH